MEVLLVYLIGAFLTFGAVWNHRKMEDPEPFDRLMDWGFPATFGGLLWPLYWPARGSVFLMQPRRPRD